MIRAKGKYRNQKLELDQPLDLEEGAEVEILIESENTDWSEMGMDRLEQEWDNPQDAIYDDWKKHYGV
ncbi:MAG: hypothetical protein L0Y72_27365 [Gemmataceae bacterium]|nr:hypothetical protein [Gemmataceae bacterium]MCI0742771.1 hypothetical protein [Gemmataceae bacterium]